MNPITSIPEISAIYYALLQSGYEFHALARDAALVEKIQGFRTGAGADRFPFFSAARQPTCEVYPFWPRAALLEYASFFLDPQRTRFQNFAALHENIMRDPHVSDGERNRGFWAWLKGFPPALRRVLASDRFQAYLLWEKEWTQQLSELHAEELKIIQTTLTAYIAKYSSPIREIQIVINPIKCVYSADYHLIGERFIFSSGAFSAESIIHEFLHPLVHPLLQSYSEEILRSPRPLPEIDASYYLDGGRAGRMNAFEEFLVRRLTRAILDAAQPLDLEQFIELVVRE